MSERNLGLFLPGHVPAAAVLAALESAPGLDTGELYASGAPRVGHGLREDRRYTHVAIPFFEEVGFLLLGETPLPASNDLEMHLGRTLSAAHGTALLLQYDDETGWGGSARFEGGALVARDAVDGREMDAVRRDLDGELVLDNLDSSDWVWPHLADAVASGAAVMFGAGIRTDDDIATLIAGASALAEPAAETVPHDPAATPQMRVQDAGDPGRLRRLLHRLAGKR